MASPNRDNCSDCGQRCGDSDLLPCSVARVSRRPWRRSRASTRNCMGPFEAGSQPLHVCQRRGRPHQQPSGRHRPQRARCSLNTQCRRHDCLHPAPVNAVCVATRPYRLSGHHFQRATRSRLLGRHSLSWGTCHHGNTHLRAWDSRSVGWYVSTIECGVVAMANWVGSRFIHQSHQRGRRIARRRAGMGIGAQENRMRPSADRCCLLPRGHTPLLSVGHRRVWCNACANGSLRRLARFDGFGSDNPDSGALGWKLEAITTVASHLRAGVARVDLCSPQHSLSNDRPDHRAAGAAAQDRRGLRVRVCRSSSYVPPHSAMSSRIESFDLAAKRSAQKSCGSPWTPLPSSAFNVRGCTHVSTVANG